MGAVTFGIPKNLVKLIKDHYAIKLFIETGTFKGQTSSWASGIFHDVITVENSKVLFDRAIRNLAVHKNLLCLYGNSAQVLQKVLAEIDQPALFWLDAHWCGGPTHDHADSFPLLDEIRIIKQSNFDHIIMIDDARYFLKPPPEPQNPDTWPGLKEITELLNKDEKYFTFVSEDIIVSMPVSGKQILQPYFTGIHRNEFPGGGIVKNIKTAFRNIYSKWKN